MLALPLGPTLLLVVWLGLAILLVLAFAYQANKAFCIKFPDLLASVTSAATDNLVSALCGDGVTLCCRGYGPSPYSTACFVASSTA